MASKRKSIPATNIKVGDSLKNARTNVWSEVAEIDDFTDWGYLIFKDKDGKRVARRLKYNDFPKANHRDIAETKRFASVRKETEAVPTPIAEQRETKELSPANQMRAKAMKSSAKLPIDTQLVDIDLKSGQSIVINYGDDAFLAINSDGILALGGPDRITQMMEIHRPTAKNRPWVISAWNDKTPVTD